VLLPVGISFYTFQAIGYLIDVSRGTLRAETNPLRTTLFVSFFPQLVAGPIERAKNLMPALSGEIRFRWRNFRIGGWLILWGLFKKLVIADRLSMLVDAAYSTPDQHSAIFLLLATYAFAFQIYCDFSAYSDIAIGSAKLFGIDLMQNFRLPYFSASLREFWARWHISLSTWFRDYLYLPLGGSRCGWLAWSRNILVVFLVSGLWHGAAWTFVIWGLIHGAGLLFEASLARALSASGIENKLKHPSLHLLRIALTFHIVLASWVFFRAESLTDATIILAKVPQIGNEALALPSVFNNLDLAVVSIALIWMLAIEAYCRGNMRLFFGIRKRWLRQTLVLSTLLLLLNFGLFSNPAQFVYFQF
jgi:D-alanyl-lipoteichoic acid acyltransferase DltB (MBOAT superfamily)